MIKVGMGWFAALGAVFGGLVVLVEALGYIAWQLTPTDEASLRQALAFEQQVMGIASSSDASLWQVSDVRKLVEAHDIAEWDHQKGRTFSEAPILAPVVEIGGLPPVSERLPQDPLVIVPPEQNGPYGGTWTRFGNGPQDVGILEARLAYDGLVRWDAMSREVIPNLAVRWEIGDGGRSYTFWLRKGVRWSDGHPCTVDDILFWYHRVLLNKTLTPVVS
ncbi:MAG: ABC transporter substrate-binding protein, partial [Candidatus Latescibacteria bacterium]|nr:ABC transporter substrate-binding protein [Candidatus Latescibacterota bacterium]